jgi:hypothetical protein
MDLICVFPKFMLEPNSQFDTIKSLDFRRLSRYEGFPFMNGIAHRTVQIHSFFLKELFTNYTFLYTNDDGKSWVKINTYQIHFLLYHRYLIKVCHKM